MALVYFLMGLLTLMLGLTLVRYVIFTVVWITTGHSFWLFPNMMEEQVRACVCVLVVSCVPMCFYCLLWSCAYVWLMVYHRDETHAHDSNHLTT